jgi:hypothetical protein
LLLFETQPNIKRTFRQYRGKKHSELRINEDLQQHIMYLMSALKRVVRYINDTKTIVKYLRRLAKKHSPLEVDLGRFDPTDLATLFCTAIRGVIPLRDQVRCLFFRGKPSSKGGWLGNSLLSLSPPTYLCNCPLKWVVL